MAKDVLVESSPLWEQFQAEARKRRRNPARLVTEYMRECLEIWVDEKLDEEISRDVQKYASKHGLTEADAVEFVRQCRREKRAKAELHAAA